MNIEVKNLDELIEAKKVSVAGYSIDINEVPIKITLNIMSMAKNVDNITEENILNNVVVPIIKHFYPDITEDEIKNSLSYKQMLALWNEIINSLYSTNKNTDDSEVKKK